MMVHHYLKGSLCCHEMLYQFSNLCSSVQCVTGQCHTEQSLQIDVRGGLYLCQQSMYDAVTGNHSGEVSLAAVDGPDVAHIDEPNVPILYKKKAFPKGDRFRE